MFRLDSSCAWNKLFSSILSSCSSSGYDETMNPSLRTDKRTVTNNAIYLDFPTIIFYRRKIQIILVTSGHVWLILYCLRKCTIWFTLRLNFIFVLSFSCFVLCCFLPRLVYGDVSADSHLPSSGRC